MLPMHLPGLTFETKYELGNKVRPVIKRYIF
jgi:hypothetical protein